MSELRQAVLLAGGLGTRFRSVRDDIPKPLAPVAGEPVLGHQLRALSAGGVARVILCVGYRHEQVQEMLGDGSAWGLELDYAIETELLGTAGAIGNARPLLDPEPFLVMNGDTLVPDLDLAGLVAQHARLNPVASLVTVRPPDPGAYGLLDLRDDGQYLGAFREKAEIDPARIDQLHINGGVYLLTPAVFDYIQPGQVCSLEQQVFPALLAAGGQVAIWAHTGFFGDMGTPAGYARVCQYFEEQAA